ncbi:hypothetical protein KE540_11805 [Lachnospiraceae bacterium Marseille-Q4251]|nr:hypothetical protein [Lachnospiraceae bacterium Marseille-Q4251]
MEKSIGKIERNTKKKNIKAKNTEKMGKNIAFSQTLQKAQAHFVQKNKM